MPSGACVIEYDGKRGKVFRVKYEDASGRQVQETLGREANGWTRRKAERELGARLSAIEKERWTRPTPETFAEFAAHWRTVWLPTRNLKRSTLVDYANTLDRHAIPYFGAMVLGQIGPEQIDGYVAEKMSTLSAKTIQNHLNLLGLILKTARRWKRIRENPLDEVDGPKVKDPETLILSEDEIGALSKAYRELAERNPEEAAWWQLTERMVVVALGTAVRRGELLALRWCDVDLLNRSLEVNRAWVRNEMTTPKSKASRRTIQYGLKTAAALEEHYKVTAYKGDAALVFGHPELGTPLDPSKLTSLYVKKALKTAGITKPIQPWHGLRHTALTAFAVTENATPALVQARAGHAQFSITERYIHAAEVVIDGLADAAEERLFGEVA
jgi:integrase